MLGQGSIAVELLSFFLDPCWTRPCGSDKKRYMGIGYTRLDRTLPRASRQLKTRGVVALLLIGVATGCSMKLPQVHDVLDAVSAWEGDFDAAERRAYRQDRPLLVYYTNAQAWEDDPMLEVLKGPELDEHMAEMTKCLLTPTHEPNRRYVQQFAVDRAPAIIILHRDGTHHSIQGPQTAAEVREFVASASPPGLPPVYNPHLPRPVRYAWTSSIDRAAEAGETRGVPVFVVIDRPFTLDWQRLAPMLERREVWSRVAGMIQCRPGLWGLGIGDAQRRFSLNNLPAVVILQPDGRYRTLELPNSYEAIARFADRAPASTHFEKATSSADPDD